MGNENDNKEFSKALKEFIKSEHALDQLTQSQFVAGMDPLSSSSLNSGYFNNINTFQPTGVATTKPSWKWTAPITPIHTSILGELLDEMFTLEEKMDFLNEREYKTDPQQSQFQNVYKKLNDSEEYLNMGTLDEEFLRLMKDKMKVLLLSKQILKLKI